MKPAGRGKTMICLPALLLAGLALAQAARADLIDNMPDLDPADATYLAMQTIPRVVYADRPDSLLDWLNAWEAADGPAEPIMRLRILGAIWDGAFDEGLYGRGIIDLLLQFCGVGHAPDHGRQDEIFRTATRDFEAFSRSFADQLLPHVPAGSVEEFFCLMYSGRQDRAWKLLASDELRGTRLRSYRDRRLRDLEHVMPVFLAVEGGSWSPFNRYAFTGDHALAGLQMGVRKGPWFGRLVMEMRLGRTEQGYLARSGDIQGVSDRFNAALVGLEFGRSVPLSGALSLEGFGGVGLDAVKPLKDEDVFLNALHLDLGGSLHLDLGSHRKWFLAATARREWIRPRNTEGTPLWGDAWSARLAVGVNLESAATEQLALLSP